MTNKYVVYKVNNKTVIYNITAVSGKCRVFQPKNHLIFRNIKIYFLVNLQNIIRMGQSFCIWTTFILYFQHHSLSFICHYIWQYSEIYSSYSYTFAMKIVLSTTLRNEQRVEYLMIINNIFAYMAHIFIVTTRLVNCLVSCSMNIKKNSRKTKIIVNHHFLFKVVRSTMRMFYINFIKLFLCILFYISDITK